MILLLDNFDSFTYNLLDYLLQLGLKCKVYRNDCALEEIEAENFNAIVFSPGPGIPSNAGIMPQLIQKYYQHLPLLGICLGHQALSEFYGAKLSKALVPMHGKLSKIYCIDDQLFNNLPHIFLVTRYHSLIITDVPDELKVLAQTSDHEIMAIRHRTFPSYGLQFHPEAVLTENGKEILKNWAILHKLIS